MLESPAGRDRHIQVFGVQDDVFDRPLDSVHSARDNLDHCPALCFELRYILGADIPVAGVHHLVARRQIDPELESPERPLLPFGHLLVDDAASGRHPLDFAGADDSLIAHAVPMLDLPRDHVGYRLDPPVGMPGEPGDVIPWLVGMKIVQHQKRVEKRDFGVSEGAFELHAGPFDCPLAAGHALYQARCLHLFLLRYRD